MAKNQNASIPTQNNINKIIQAYVNDVDEIIDIVINSANKYGTFKTVIKPIENYKNIISYIFSKDGVIHLITSVINKVDSTKSNKIVSSVRKLINNLNKLVNYITESIAGMITSISTIDLMLFKNVYVNLVNGLNDVFTILNDLKPIKFLGIKLFSIRFQFRQIKRFVDKISESSDKIFSSLNKTIKIFSKIKLFESLITAITYMINLIIGFRFRPALFKFKLRQAKRSIKKISKLIKTIDKLFSKVKPITIIKAAIYINMILMIFMSLQNIINTVKEITIGFKFIWKLFILKLAIKRLVKVVKILGKLDASTINGKTVKSMFSLFLIISMIKYVFSVIRGSKLGLKLWYKLLMLKLSISLLNNILLDVKKIKIVKSHFDKLKKLTRFFKKIKNLFNIITKSLPAIILGSTALVALSMSMLLFSAATLLIIRIIKVIGRKMTPLLFIRLLLIQFFIMQIASMMLALSLVAVIATLVAVPIVTMLLLFAVIVGIITLISWIVTAAIPILASAMVGFIILGTIFLIMFSLIAILKLLEIITLDKEKIKENIKCVLDTTRMIIDVIFGEDENKNEKSKKTWIESVVQFVGGTLATIIKAIMSVAFLAIMVVAILFILIIAGQLRLLQEINLDINKINTNVNLIISTAQSISNILFNKEDNETKKSQKSWISSVIENFAGNLMTIIRAIMSVAFLAISIVAITLILLIAGQLRLLQEINLDPEKISSNVTTVIDTVQSVINAITNKKDKDTEGSNKSWIKSLLEFVGADGLINIIDAIMSIAWLGFAIGIISLVKVLAEQLASIGSIQMPDNINKKIDDIVLCANSVISAIDNRADPLSKSGDEKKTSFLKWMFPNLSEAAEMMSRMRWLSSAVSTVGMIKQLVDVLVTINDLPHLNNVEKNATSICSTADSIIKLLQNREEINVKELTHKTNDINAVIKSLNNIYDAKSVSLEKSENIVSNTEKFVKHLNDIDAEKIKLVDSTFKSMTKLSANIKDNFKELANAIDKELLPMLEELKDIMDKIPEKLEVGFQNTSASIGAAAAPATTSNTEAQVLRENPNLSAQDVERIVRNRMNERAAADANGVSAKLDELIALLKGFGGNQVVVRTI